MRYRDRLAAAAVPTGFAILLGLPLLLARATGEPSRLAYSAIFGIGLGLVVALFAVGTSSRLEGEAGGIAAVAFVGWAPPMMLGASAALQTTIAGSGPSPDAPMFFTGVFVVVALLWTLLTPHLNVKVLGRAASRAAPFVMAAGALLVVVALVRAISRPDPDMWIARTNTVATIPAGGKLDVKGTALVHERRVVPKLKILTTAYVPPEQRKPAEDDPSAMVELCELDAPSRRYLMGTDCKTMELADDPRTGLSLLRQEGTAPGNARSSFFLRVFRDDVFQEVHVTAVSIAKGVSPPVGWTHGAAGGLVLALGAFLGSRKRRNAARAVHGTNATHLNRGKVLLESGETIDVPSMVDAPHGAVRLEVPPPESASYRAMPHAGVRYLGPGKLEAVRSQLETSAGGAALASVVIVLVTAAPLVVAAAYGLLF